MKDAVPRTAQGRHLDNPEVQAAADKWVTDAAAELAAASPQPTRPSVEDTAKYDKLVEQEQDTVAAAGGGRQTTTRPATARCSS